LETAHFNLEKASLETVKGITYRNDGQVFKTPDRGVIFVNRHIPGYLDKYPSPYLSGIINSAKLGIITSRGCNQHCVYCICAVMSRRKIATHSVDRVIEELDYIAGNLVEDNPPVVDIFDDTFTLLPARALEICKKIIENKIKLPLSCITRCDKVDEELLDTMKEAGVKSIEFSLESAVPRLLRIAGKVRSPHTKEDHDFEKETAFIESFKKYITYAKKIGIENVFASIMIGLPTETPEEGRQTIGLMNSLIENIDFYGHNIFNVHPGTPLFSYCEKEYGFKLIKRDSQVHYRTILGYDTRQVPLAPKSHFEVLGKQKDMDNIKTMALLLSATKKKNPKLNNFNKIILCADVITKELVVWLQEYLAVNGSFIHIYSGLAGAKDHYQENEKTMDKYISPTKYYAAYYRTDEENGNVTLTPLRTYLLEKRCGIDIYLVNTQAGILNSERNPLQSIGIDRPGEKQDVLQLYHFLMDIAKDGNIMNVLFNRPTYPYFSSLCRWEKGEANCRRLETVIVDADYNIKTCWNGDPIGKVGMQLPDIVENLKHLQREAEKKRGCSNCQKNSVCTRCIFPNPMSGREYCDIRKGFNTGESVEAIRTFDGFKELNFSRLIHHHGGIG
jgi:hypothetical protein